MTFNEIANDFEKLNLKSYRARQVWKWLCAGVKDIDDMTNISKDFRDYMNKNYFIPKIKIDKKLVSKDGTIKYLFELDDKQYIETVLMKYKHGYSICISTQVGCKMGCVFCNTGQSGFFRNLRASEMILQIEAVQEDCNIKISNVVLMGMGEPLDNFDNVLKFLEIVTSEDGLNIGMRHISLSTCGIVDKIYKLAEYKFQLTLSISLHAPNDKIRNSIMKINNRWGVNELTEACKYYIKKTGRRISFEYVMINDLTDTKECALQLSKLLKGMLCHVNLISLNVSENNEISESRIDKIYSFKNILEENGINVTVRRSLGQDINAACGQLRRKKVL